MNGVLGFYPMIPNQALRGLGFFTIQVVNPNIRVFEEFLDRFSFVFCKSGRASHPQNFGNCERGRYYQHIATLRPLNDPVTLLYFSSLRLEMS